MQHLYSIQKSVTNLGDVKDHLVRGQIGNKKIFPEDYPIVNRHKQVEVKAFLAANKKLVLYTYAQEANLFVENYIQHYQTTGSLYYPIKACVAALNKAAYISRSRVLKYMNSINGLIIVDKQDGKKTTKQKANTIYKGI
ncbi:unnamed protein product [Didymodactylos carnosus]|uniref:Uncharacterized protein n=1 Tax=Didymodactylos carnosus TaxID=1234261 RepID=A0A8S2N275_9BILA|nr:unnamed protein product [Didymodactylos carnosus]CAF3983650.1 unnamed protein product [Didymodactylos carnosus]